MAEFISGALKGNQCEGLLKLIAGPAKAGRAAQNGREASKFDASLPWLFHRCFASLDLEQPVNGPPDVMPSMMPVVVMMIIPVGIIAIRICPVGIIINYRIHALWLIAIRLIAIWVINIRIWINVLLIPLRVGWNDVPHQH
jgi:hypothetical protein